MTKNEIKCITENWLISKGFKKSANRSETEYVFELPDFDIYILFLKERFTENFYFVAGFKFNDDPLSWGHVRVNVQKKVDSYSYTEWTKENYMQSLERMHELYVQPYMDLGTKMLKKIVKNQFFRGNYYLIHANAIDKINKM